jgi:hypothetical protein
MVARIENEMLTQELHTPRPDLSDSDDVLLALETARALETQGEIREAVRWLRRAADEAEKQGNDERVLALARAAADLSNTLGPAQSAPPPAQSVPPAPSAAEVPTMPPPAISAAEVPTLSPPGAENTTPPSDSGVLTVPPVSAAVTVPPPFPAATVPPATPAPVFTVPSDMPLTERSMRIGAVRVAISENSIRGAKSFFVERLEKGQLAPPGTMEAMLVFSGEIGVESELEPDLPTMGSAAAL